MNDWFRLYNEIIESPKLLMLSPADRWYYTAVLALKNADVLDEYKGDKLQRVIATKLRLTMIEWEETRRRLQEEDLLDAKCQPVGWEDRQYKHKKAGSSEGDMYFYVAGDKSPGATSPVRMGFSKNPWSRAKEFRKQADSKIFVVTTMITTNGNDQQLRSLFENEIINDGWFRRSGEILLVINELKRKSLSSFGALADYVAELRSNYVATTTDNRLQSTDKKHTADPCGSGATAPPAQIVEPPNLNGLWEIYHTDDPETEIYKHGCSLLGRSGMDYQASRHFLAKLINEYGEGNVFDALVVTLIDQPSSPSKYLPKVLSNRGRPISKDWKPSSPCLSHLNSLGIPDDVIREARDPFVMWFWHTQVPSNEFERLFETWCLRDWERADANKNAYLNRLRAASGFATAEGYDAQDAPVN